MGLAPVITSTKKPGPKKNTPQGLNVSEAKKLHSKLSLNAHTPLQPPRKLFTLPNICPPNGQPALRGAEWSDLTERENNTRQGR